MSTLPTIFSILNILFWQLTVVAHIPKNRHRDSWFKPNLEYESFSDCWWRNWSQILKIYARSKYTKFGIQKFFGSLTMNLESEFENTKRRIQYSEIYRSFLPSCFFSFLHFRKRTATEKTKTFQNHWLKERTPIFYRICAT